MVEQTLLRKPVDPMQQAIALTHAALAALRRGDYPNGERLLRAALRLDPGLAVAWLWLGALKQGARRSICLRWARLSMPHAEIPSLSRLRRRPQPVRSVSRRSLLAAGGVTALSLAFGAFRLAYAERVYPGIAVLGQPLSGKTQAEAGPMLEQLVTQWAEVPLVLQVGDVRHSLPLGRLARFDAQALARQAFEVGRAGPLFSRLADQSEALLSSQTLNILPAPDEQRLSRLIDELASGIRREAAPAQFVRQAGTWRIRPQRDGLVLDAATARKLLRTAWNSHAWSEAPTPLVVELPLRTVRAQPTAADLAPRLAQLRHQTAQPLVLSWDGGELVLDRGLLVELERLPAPGRPFAVSQTEVAALLRQLQAEIDREAQPSRLVRDGNYVRDFALRQVGRRLDVAAGQQRVASALEHGERTVALPVELLEPPPGEAERLGLVAVVGEGRSQFASYSSADRDQNVLLGGREFDGLLVPPGGIVSANETIGSITLEQGYRWGEMIAGGRMVPSLGGGVCQVTTTLFRAAFWSGLEILERHNHQWRLPWYEVDAPAGMDAAIALGGPDLKIRNNTGQYIVIKMTTDLEHKTQRCTLYGTPAGWQVQMLGPEYRANAVLIGRRVLKDGALIREDRFTSYYTTRR